MSATTWPIAIAFAQAVLVAAAQSRVATSQDRVIPQPRQDRSRGGKLVAEVCWLQVMHGQSLLALGHHPPVSTSGKRYGDSSPMSRRSSTYARRSRRPTPISSAGIAPLCLAHRPERPLK